MFAWRVQSLRQLHEYFFRRFHSLAQALTGCRSMAELEPVLETSPPPDVRDIWLERLQQRAIAS